MKYFVLIIYLLLLFTGKYLFFLIDIEYNIYIDISKYINKTRPARERHIKFRNAGQKKSHIERGTYNV